MSTVIHSFGIKWNLRKDSGNDRLVISQVFLNRFRKLLHLLLQKLCQVFGADVQWQGNKVSSLL